MALNTKKQFAERVSMTTRQLSVYISRRKVVVVDELIDPLNDTNKAFLLKYGGKADVRKENVEPKKTAPGKSRKNKKANSKQPIGIVQKGQVRPSSEDDDEESSDDSIMKIWESEQEYQHWRALKNKTSVVKADLEIAKMKGEYIATGMVKALFQQHNQSVLMAMKNMLDGELRFMAKQFDIPLVRVAEIKGRWIKSLNEATDNARKATAKSVTNIINEYTGNA